MQRFTSINLRSNTLIPALVCVKVERETQQTQEHVILAPRHQTSVATGHSDYARGAHGDCPHTQQAVLDRFCKAN